MAEVPLMIVSLAFLAGYSVQVLSPDPGLGKIAQTVVLVTWFAFAIDYAVTLVLVPNRAGWFFRHLHLLAVVLLPALRPLRLLRLITLVTVLQRVAGNALRGRVVTYVIGASALLVYLAALAMYDTEHLAAGAHIESFGDALWWAIETITTVGYGDMFPVTVTGRLIAVALMICGIALLGVVTATLASWLVEKVSAEEAKGTEITAEHLSELKNEVQLLRQELAQKRALTEG